MSSRRPWRLMWQADSKPPIQNEEKIEARDISTVDYRVRAWHVRESIDGASCSRVCQSASAGRRTNSRSSRARSGTDLVTASPAQEGERFRCWLLHITTMNCSRQPPAAIAPAYTARRWKTACGADGSCSFRSEADA